MAPHSSTLAWKIPWTEEADGLQSMGSLRVGQDWATSLSRIGEGNGNPLQCSCLENPRDGGVWWAAVFGVTQSRTWLKQLSSSSSSSSIYVCIPPARWILNHWNTRKAPRHVARCPLRLACFKALLDPEWPGEEGQLGFKSCCHPRICLALGELISANLTFFSPSVNES